MRKAFLALAIAITCSFTIIACSKKTVEEKLEDYVVNVMSDGQWIVTKYMEGTTDLTATFAGWECQFNKDRSCVARNGATVYNGTWNSSTPDQTITGNFPAGADPINRVNGTWKIMRTSLVMGEFSQDKNGVTHSMTLTKK